MVAELRPAKKLKHPKCLDEGKGILIVNGTVYSNIPSAVTKIIEDLAKLQHPKCLYEEKGTLVVNGMVYANIPSAVTKVIEDLAKLHGSTK